MRVVALETSGAVASVALYEDGELVAEGEQSVPNAHGERVLPMLDAMLADAQWEVGEVERWAVGVGPGSFTGIRVGIALAKGIAIATGAELVAVTSLDAVTAGLDGGAISEGDRERVIPGTAAKRAIAGLVRAGKGELFLQVRAGTGVLLEACHVRVEGVARKVAEVVGGMGVVVAGEGANLVDWSELAGEVSLRTEAPHDFARARVVGRLAIARRRSGGEVEPIYVRPPEITMPKARKVDS